MTTWTSYCDAGQCLEAACDSNGVVLLRNSSHPEIAPKPFSEVEWNELLEVIDGAAGLHWIEPAFPAVVGLPATREDLVKFREGVRAGAFEYNVLPLIGED